ncbi:MAG: HemK2/MTQ2 family protein methyltransferase [Solirubrobacterales bacterium]
MTPAVAVACPRIVALPGVYQPISDSILLMDAFAAGGPARPSSVLDLCCGSGVQGISAALRGHRVTAVDVEPLAIENVATNADANDVEVEALQGSLFEPVEGRRFDAILANPPYVPTPDDESIGHHVYSDGGRDGRLLIDQICSQASSMLVPGGSLWMVHSSLASIEMSVAQLEDAGLVVDEVASMLEPLGPICTERQAYLREKGYLEPDATHERLAVLRASRPHLRSAAATGNSARNALYGRADKLREFGTLRLGRARPR